MNNLSNRSLGELFTDLSRDIAVLVRKEIELAKVEMSRIGVVLARRVAYMAVGAVLCVAGLLSLVGTATLAGIAMGLSALAASAIVTLLMLAVGGLLLMQGMAALRKESLLPTETIQSLKDTGEIFRGHSLRRGPSVTPAGSDGREGETNVRNTEKPRRRACRGSAVRQGLRVAGAAVRTAKARAGRRARRGLRCAPAGSGWQAARSRGVSRPADVVVGGARRTRPTSHR